MPMLEPGQNPRDILHRHRERGPRRYEFTIEEVAKVMNRAVASIRGERHWSKPDEPWSLRRLIQRVQRAWHYDAPPPLADEQMSEWFDEREMIMWAKRWPRFPAFRCIEPGCKELLLISGFCHPHGGPYYPALRLGHRRYVEIYTGRATKAYARYHSVVHPAPKGMHVHHMDFNKWNNHPDNLETLTPDEHMEKHNHYWAQSPDDPKIVVDSAR